MQRASYVLEKKENGRYERLDEVLKILEFDKIRELLVKEATTPFGKELAKDLLPLVDIEEINLNLLATSEAKKVLEEGYHVIGSFFDIRTSIQRARVGSLLEILELSNIFQALLTIREVKIFFKNIILDIDHLKTLGKSIEILGELEKELQKTVSDNGAILDSATLHLAHIRRQKNILKNKIKKVLGEILEDTSKQKIFQDKIITIRLDRYVIPVKQEYKKQLPGIIHDQSQTGSTYFIEPLAVVNINNEIKKLSLEEAEEINSIRRFFTQKIALAYDIFIHNLEVIGLLDFAFAKARLALKMHATKPELNLEKKTQILKGRHPLLSDTNVVPLDFTIGSDYRMLLITGPNTGGKTVTMKTIGLLSLMAQAGLFIPAAEGSTLPVYKKIFADIGDEQSIEESLSTFSSHMQNIVNILANVGENDLVLLDEIGAGTDPEEGAALAIAILEYLLQRNIILIATTHYSALKTFAYKREGILNASMEFDEKTLKPTYRLLLGLPGTSRAFHISQRLGLKEAIIKRARDIIHIEHTRFEDLVEKLERQKRFYEEENLKLQSKERNLQKLEYETKRQKEAIESQKNHIIQKAKEEGLNIVRDTKKMAESIIKDLKKQFQEQDTRTRQQEIDRVRKTIAETSDVINQKFLTNAPSKQKVATEKIALGDIVLVEKIGQEGEVIDTLGKELIILLGSIKMNVKRDECFFVRHKKTIANIPARKNRAFLKKTQNISLELDLRGMMVEEGELKTEKFIDDALLAGLKEIIIIHGKGTGKLRQGIHDYLQKHPSVKNYAFADLAQGGSGATVVELK